MTERTPGPRPPWWIPTWPVCLGVGLYVMTFWILWTLSPAQGQEPSELFKLLAQAIALTAFVSGVVGGVYTISRDSEKKTETIANQARVIAAGQDGAPDPGAGKGKP